MEVNRKCCRCRQTKAIEQFIGKKPNTITNTCRDCRDSVDGKKAAGDRLRTAMRELFLEAR